MINYIIGIGTGLFVVWFIVSKIVHHAKKAPESTCNSCCGCSCSQGCTKCHN